MAQRLKEEGNALLAAKDYVGAEAKYSEAIEQSRDVAVLFSNRALARFLQNKFVESLADADECIRLQSSFLKGHFHRVRALLALGPDRADEAQRAFWRGLEAANGSENPAFAALERAVSEARISGSYTRATRDLAVEVRYVDETRGKGLFSKKDVRMFRQIFSEVPLVSHRKLFEHGAPDACSFCLRSFAARSDVEATKFGPMFQDIYPEPPKWIYCLQCEARAEEMTGWAFSWWCVLLNSFFS
jgi:tetratricopeptide (TPR) repeat protein